MAIHGFGIGRDGMESALEVFEHSSHCPELPCAPRFNRFRPASVPSDVVFRPWMHRERYDQGHAGEMKL